MDLSLIIKPEIKVEEHLDVVTEVAKEILEENEPEHTVCEASEMEENRESPTSEDIFKYVPDVRDLDEPVKVIQEIAQVHHQDPEETLTISDSLAKNHFPELLEQTQNVFEVYEQGEVIEQWYTVQPEKAASNVEVLEKLENDF